MKIIRMNGALWPLIWLHFFHKKWRELSGWHASAHIFMAYFRALGRSENLGGGAPNIIEGHLKVA